MSQGPKEGVLAKPTSRRSSLRDLPELRPLWSRLDEVLEDVLRHPGFGEIKIDTRWLKRGQKEVIIACGKQYRFVVPVPDDAVSSEKKQEDAQD